MSLEIPDKWCHVSTKNFILKIVANSFYMKVKHTVIYRKTGAVEETK